MDAHRWRQDLKDVGDQALMRGLDSKRGLEAALHDVGVIG